jgi:hypothetical protein
MLKKKAVASKAKAKACLSSQQLGQASWKKMNKKERPKTYF